MGHIWTYFWHKLIPAHFSSPFRSVTLGAGLSRGINRGPPRGAKKRYSTCLLNQGQKKVFSFGVALSRGILSSFCMRVDFSRGSTGATQGTSKRWHPPPPQKKIKGGHNVLYWILIKRLLDLFVLSIILRSDNVFRVKGTPSMDRIWQMRPGLTHLAPFILWYAHNRIQVGGGRRGLYAPMRDACVLSLLALAATVYLQEANFPRQYPEAEFLDVIGIKVLSVFLLAIFSHLY